MPAADPAAFQLPDQVPDIQPADNGSAGCNRKEGATGPAAEDFAPLYLFGLDPIIHGLVVSFGLGVGVSLLTKPLPASEVDRYFLAGEEDAGVPVTV